MEDWRDKLGVVFSTNSEFEYAEEPKEEVVDVDRAKQNLRVFLDKKMRGGKKVTIVSSYKGSDESIKELGKMLKTKCGVGGSVKDGEIIVQGDFREKIVEILKKEGYIKSRII